VTRTARTRGRDARLPHGETREEQVILEALRDRAWPRTKRLADGSTGYFIPLPRLDACWAAAVATCLQVPIEELPDSRIDERLQAGWDPEAINADHWSQWGHWLEGHGLRIVEHAPLPLRRWVGIVPEPGVFHNHALVMAGERILFDPVGALGYPFKRWPASRVRWGYSFTTT